VGIIGAIGGFFKAIGAAFGWLKDRQLLQAGRQAEKADSLSIERRRIATARAASAAVVGDLDRRGTGGLRDDPRNRSRRRND
jgi:hypothetical protein